MSDEFQIAQGQRCRHLRSKGMYVNHGLPPGQEAAGDGHFWCLSTQTMYGPDDDICDGENCCNTGRGCYETQ